MELALVDEAGSQPVTAGVAKFSRPIATVREVIRARAELHWEEARRVFGDGTSAERGFGSLFQDVTKRDAIAKAAEKAFLAGRFFLLLDDRQVEDLDEEIDLARTGAATFLLITPLKGG